MRLTLAEQKSLEIVERLARALGKHVIIQFTRDGCEVEDTSWSGSSTGETLLDAFKDAVSGEE